MFLNTFAINKEWVIARHFREIQTHNFQFVKSIGSAPKLSSLYMFKQIQLGRITGEYQFIFMAIGRAGNFKPGINISDPVLTQASRIVRWYQNHIYWESMIMMWTGRGPFRTQY